MNLISLSPLDQNREIRAATYKVQDLVFMGALVITTSILTYRNLLHTITIQEAKSIVMKGVATTNKIT